MKCGNEMSNESTCCCDDADDVAINWKVNVSKILT